MKTKIFFILTFVLVLCFNEIKAQDTLWTRKTGYGTFTLDGSKVLWIYGQGQNQLLTSDSGKVIWTDSTDLGGAWMTPDSLHFLVVSDDTIIFRRLSDGAVVKKYDTLITNNYPPHTSLSWYFTSYAFSKDGRYLFLTTSDQTVFPTPPNGKINDMIYKIDLQTDQLAGLKTVTSCFIFKAATNDSFLICGTSKGIFFFSVDNLNFVKAYWDTCSMNLSKSGRYITTTGIYGDIHTWDTQYDTVIKNSKLDSIDILFELQCTNNDSIVYLLCGADTVAHLIKYNLFTEERLKDFIFSFDFYINGRFELSGDETKLLIYGRDEGLYMYGLTSQPTAKKDDNNQRTIIRIIPNPTPGTTEIELTLEQNEKVNITLYDSSGKFVMDLGEKFFDVGINRFSFSTKKLPNGSYFVNIKSDRMNQTEKLLINK